MSKISVPRADMDAFMADLTEVAHKHGILISGCGCCGSPYLIKMDARSGRYKFGDSYGYLSWSGSDKGTDYIEDLT